MQSRSVLLKNMFDPEEYVDFISYRFYYLNDILPRETEQDWDKDLAEDVKGECENKYGPVTAIKVEKDTQASFITDLAQSMSYPDFLIGRDLRQI